VIEVFASIQQEANSRFPQLGRSVRWVSSLQYDYSQWYRSSWYLVHKAVLLLQSQDYPGKFWNLAAGSSFHLSLSKLFHFAWNI